MRRLVAISVILMFTAFTAGCLKNAVRDAAMNLEVSVADVSVKIDAGKTLGSLISGKTNLSGTVFVDLMVRNNNPFSVKAGRTSFDLFVNDIKIGSGVAGNKSPLSLKPGKSGRLNVSMKVDLTDKELSALKKIKSGADILIKGTTDVNALGTKIKVPFKSRKKL